MEAWRHLVMTFFYGLANILPWFVAGTAAAVVVSLTPFGRALTRFLRESRSDSAIPREIEEALAALRADTSEVLERLDFLERALAQRELTPGPPRPALPPVVPGTDSLTGRVRTPV